MPDIEEGRVTSNLFLVTIVQRPWTVKYHSKVSGERRSRTIEPCGIGFLDGGLVRSDLNTIFPRSKLFGVLFLCLLSVNRWRDGGERKDSLYYRHIDILLTKLIYEGETMVANVGLVWIESKNINDKP